MEKNSAFLIVCVSIDNLMYTKDYANMFIESKTYGMFEFEINVFFFFFCVEVKHNESSIFFFCRKVCLRCS